MDPKFLLFLFLVLLSPDPQRDHEYAVNLETTKNISPPPVVMEDDYAAPYSTTSQIIPPGTKNAANEFAGPQTSNIAQSSTKQSADEFAVSPPITNSKVPVAVIFSFLSTLGTCLLSFYLSRSLALRFARNTKAWYCVILIACTPAVHALEQHYTVHNCPTNSGLSFTILEGSKEVYSASAAIWFLALLDLELEKRYGDNVLAVLDKKEFTVHYPFDLFQPLKFTASEKKLLFMRRACYLPVPLVVVMYGFRALFEFRQEVSEMSLHFFHVAVFLMTSVGFLAVYVISQGVESKLAEKIGFYKLFFFLLWIEGPGVAMFHSIQSYLVATTIVCWVVRQIWLFEGFKLVDRRVGVV